MKTCLYLGFLITIGILWVDLTHANFPDRDSLDVRIGQTTSMTEVGRIELDFDPMSISYIRELHAHGNYVYVLTFSPAILWIINVSNPTRPYVESMLELPPNDGHELWYSDGYVFVGHRWGGLHMIDVSDPKHPTIVSFVQTDYIHRGLYTIGHYLYYAEHQAGDLAGGLVIFDISEGKLHQVGSYIEEGDVLDGKWPVVTSDERYAYQVIGDAGHSECRVNIYDITDKANPRYVGSFNRGIKSREIAITPDDRFLFIASLRSGLQIFDITHRTSPRLVRTIEGDISTIALDSENTILYAVDGGSKIHAIDVSAPATAIIVETVSGVDVGQISQSGRYLYAGAGGWEPPKSNKNWLYIYTKYSGSVAHEVPMEEALLSVQSALIFPGDSISVHLKTEGREDITGAKILLSYNPERLTALHVQTTDFTSDFVLAHVIDQEMGRIGISLASAFEIGEQAGNLVRIIFLVSPLAAPGDTTRITITELSLVDTNAAPIPSEGTGGLLRVIGVPGDVSADNTVDIDDAVLCLKIAVGLEPPPIFPGYAKPAGFKRRLADINADGEVNAADALLILLQSLEEWLPAPSGESSKTIASADRGSLDLVEIPVQVASSIDAKAADIVVGYEHEALEFVNAVPSVFGSLMAVNSGDEGHLRIALVNVDGITTPLGEILRVTFRPRANAGKIYELPFESLSLYDINGRLIQLQTDVGHTFEERQFDRSTYGLRENYPNPFNETTTLVFSIPPILQPEKVELTVFNLVGQRIRTLIDSEVWAGEYRYIWDGKDEVGREVSSGVYLYRLTIGNKSWQETRKMTLMR